MQAATRHMELQQIEHQMHQVSEPVRMTADRAAWERGEPLQPRLDWTALAEVKSGHTPVIAGEVLYHLRTAQDYLVYNLAWLDTGAPQEHTAFPIVTGDKWNSEGRRQVKHLSSAHREAIRAYQPFAGCTWTSDLRELSNQDKHRLIVDVANEIAGGVVISSDTVRPDRDDPSRLVIDVVPDMPQLVMDDGRPVVPLLGGLIREVSRTIFAFQGDFGELDQLHIEPG